MLYNEKKQTILKNETVQQIHDMNKNRRTLSTLSTSVKQISLINNFDTHL
jgi:RPA family protein